MVRIASRTPEFSEIGDSLSRLGHLMRVYAVLTQIEYKDVKYGTKVVLEITMRRTASC